VYDDVRAGDSICTDQLSNGGIECDILTRVRGCVGQFVGDEVKMETNAD
jgi:hypothetical protein